MKKIFSLLLLIAIHHCMFSMHEKQLTLKDLPAELLAHIFGYMPLSQKIKEFGASIGWSQVGKILRKINLLPTHTMRLIARERLERRFHVSMMDDYTKQEIERYTTELKFTPSVLEQMNLSQKIFMSRFFYYEWQMGCRLCVEKNSKREFCFAHTGFFRLMMNKHIPFTMDKIRFWKFLTARAQYWNSRHVFQIVTRYSDRNKHIPAQEIKILRLIDRLAKEKECF